MDRRGVVAGAVCIALLLIAIGIEYRGRHPRVPPPHESRDCLQPAQEHEDLRERFARRGGLITRYPNAQWQGDSYTAAAVAQGRNLPTYDRLELRDREHLHPWQWWRNPILAQARSFVWEHWQNRKKAYLVLTQSSVDHTGTAHIFIEPDDSGRWRVYERDLDRRELVDLPTGYSVTWARREKRDQPAIPLASDERVDPLIHELEFHDICGEVVGSL